MPKNLVDPDLAARPVFVLSQRYESLRSPWHQHRCAQFVYASEGVHTVRTDAGLWVVPPQRAVWILPGERHRGSAKRGCWLRTLYAQPGAVPVPPQCCVVNVDPLLRLLLVEASGFGPDHPAEGPEQRLMQVIIDRLAALAVVPTGLPAAADPRLVRLTCQLEVNPADSRPLAALAADCGMTERTAARLFLKDTGLSFGQWRQQLRLLKAMEPLSLGRSVTQVAFEVGYADVSSFIAVFRQAFGETPARYFRKDDE